MTGPMSASGSPLVWLARISALDLGRRVADREPQHEPVQLRLGEGIGALVLDRVLRGDHHERRAQRVGLGVDRDLTLLHAFEQRRLRLGGGAVDLVPQHDVGEDRAGPELEVALLLVEDVDAGDIGGQQVGRELQSAERAVDRTRDRLGQHGLADAGHVLDQEVSLGDQGDERQPDLTVLAPHDLLDVGLDLPELGREPLPVLGTLANLHPVTPSRATGPRGPARIHCANDPVIVRHIHVSETPAGTVVIAAQQGCRGGGGKFPQARRPSEPRRHEVRAAVRPSTRTPRAAPIRNSRHHARPVRRRSPSRLHPCDSFAREDVASWMDPDWMNP